MLKFINTGGKIGFCDMPVKKKKPDSKRFRSRLPIAIQVSEKTEVH